MAVAVVERGGPAPGHCGEPACWYVSALWADGEQWVEIGDDHATTALCVGSARRLHRALGDVLGILG